MIFNQIDNQEHQSLNISHIKKCKKICSFLNFLTLFFLYVASFGDTYFKK